VAHLSNIYSVRESQHTLGAALVRVFTFDLRMAELVSLISFLAISALFVALIFSKALWALINRLMNRNQGLEFQQAETPNYF